jgi:hypothetical protein
MENKLQPPPDQAPFDEKLRLHLGDRLKLLFAETERTPIPDRFSQLLDQLQAVGAHQIGAVQGQKVGRAACEDADDSSEAGR